MRKQVEKSILGLLVAGMRVQHQLNAPWLGLRCLQRRGAPRTYFDATTPPNTNSTNMLASADDNAAIFA